MVGIRLENMHIFKNAPLNLSTPKDRSNIFSYSTEKISYRMQKKHRKINTSDRYAQNVNINYTAIQLNTYL